jgi:hypothetical protein
MPTRKSCFYLDHRQDIETWAALHAEGRQLLPSSGMRMFDDVPMSLISRVLPASVGSSS